MTFILPPAGHGRHHLSRRRHFGHHAAHPDGTDWPQILAVYNLLERVAPSPVVTLNRAVAVAMVNFRLAAERATSLPERRYLESRAARLAGLG
jgi:predicted RNA polymerase sigma factor